MSMRPLIYPVSSIDPIREAMGSGDASLVERMAEAYSALYKGGADPESLKRVRETGRGFIQGKLRGKKEPGEWEEAIHLLARARRLLRSKLPVNEDWKWMAWSDYFEEVADQLPADARQLLKWLVEGRPLKGTAVDSRGSYYAWLESDEVKRLLAALKELEKKNPAVTEIIEEFHEELVEWLEACRGKALLLLAS